jgi:hypothetical protein
MHRSKESLLLSESTANALWGKSPSPCPEPNESTPRPTESLSPCMEPNELFKSTPPRPSVCFDRVIQQLQRDHRQCLDESAKRENNQTSRNRALVDDIKMDHLLGQLRTSNFVGTIDPKCHSHYLTKAFEDLLEESAKNCSARISSKLAVNPIA